MRNPIRSLLMFRFQHRSRPLGSLTSSDLSAPSVEGDVHVSKSLWIAAHDLQRRLLAQDLAETVQAPTRAPEPGHPLHR